MSVRHHVPLPQLPDGFRLNFVLVVYSKRYQPNTTSNLYQAEVEFHCTVNWYKADGLTEI